MSTHSTANTSTEAQGEKEEKKQILHDEKEGETTINTPATPSEQVGAVNNSSTIVDAPTTSGANPTVPSEDEVDYSDSPLGADGIPGAFESNELAQNTRSANALASPSNGTAGDCTPTKEAQGPIIVQSSDEETEDDEDAIVSTKNNRNKIPKKKTGSTRGLQRVTSSATNRSSSHVHGRPSNRMAPHTNHRRPYSASDSRNQAGYEPYRQRRSRSRDHGQARPLAQHREWGDSMYKSRPGQARRSRLRHQDRSRDRTESSKRAYQSTEHKGKPRYRYGHSEPSDSAAHEHQPADRQEHRENVLQAVWQDRRPNRRTSPIRHEIRGHNVQNHMLQVEGTTNHVTVSAGTMNDSNEERDRARANSTSSTTQREQGWEKTIMEQVQQLHSYIQARLPDETRQHARTDHPADTIANRARESGISDEKQYQAAQEVVNAWNKYHNEQLEVATQSSANTADVSSKIKQIRELKTFLETTILCVKTVKDEPPKIDGPKTTISSQTTREEIHNLLRRLEAAISTDKSRYHAYLPQCGGSGMVVRSTHVARLIKSIKAPYNGNVSNFNTFVEQLRAWMLLGEYWGATKGRILQYFNATQTHWDVRGSILASQQGQDDVTAYYDRLMILHQEYIDAREVSTQWDQQLNTPNQARHEADDLVARQLLSGLETQLKTLVFKSYPSLEKKNRKLSRTAELIFATAESWEYQALKCHPPKRKKVTKVVNQRNITTAGGMQVEISNEEDTVGTTSTADGPQRPSRSEAQWHLQQHRIPEAAITAMDPELQSDLFMMVVTLPPYERTGRCEACEGKHKTHFCSIGLRQNSRIRVDEKYLQNGIPKWYQRHPQYYDVTKGKAVFPVQKCLEISKEIRAFLNNFRRG